MKCTAHVIILGNSAGVHGSGRRVPAPIEKNAGDCNFTIEMAVSRNDGKPVQFWTVPELIPPWIEAREERPLARMKKQPASLDLPILDALGYVPTGKLRAEFLFDRIGRAFEPTSLIVAPIAANAANIRMDDIDFPASVELLATNFGWTIVAVTSPVEVPPRRHLPCGSSFSIISRSCPKTTPRPIRNAASRQR